MHFTNLYKIGWGLAQRAPSAQAGQEPWTVSQQDSEQEGPSHGLASKYRGGLGAPSLWGWKALAGLHVLATCCRMVVSRAPSDWPQVAPTVCHCSQKPCHPSAPVAPKSAKQVKPWPSLPAVVFRP